MAIAKADMSSRAVIMNFTANVMQFALRFVLGIWYTRFLIRNLGADLYGLIPLAYSFTEYFSLITLILNAPAGRFLIIARSQGNYEEENSIFNTVFWGTCGICVVLLLLTPSVSYLVPLFMSIPKGHEMDARLIFLSVGLSFIATTFRNPFSLSTYVTNKLYLRTMGEAVENVSRVAIPVGLILLWHWNIGGVVFGLLTAATIGLLTSLVFWRYLTPELHIQWRRIHVGFLRSITSMGGWMFIAQIGGLLFLQSELIVVNKLFGPTETGKYGALLVFPMMFRAVAGMLSVNLQPIIMDRYAKKDMAGVLRFITLSSRLIGIVMALPLALVCFFAAPILRIWLGSDYTVLAPVLVVMIAHLPVTLAVSPMFTLPTMANRVRTPGLVIAFLGVVNVLLALTLGSPRFGLGVIGVPLAGAIVLLAKNALFSPAYGAAILGIPTTRMLAPMRSGIVGFIACGAICIIVGRLLDLLSLFRLLAAATVVGGAYYLFAWNFLLSEEERILLKRQLSSWRGR